MLSKADAKILRKMHDKAAELENDVLRATVQAALADLPLDPCPYTMSHTREWCGHPLCRAS